MKTKLLYIVIICLQFIYSCKRTETSCGDLSDVNTYYNISAADKAKIPYTGTDTLVFISDENDTAMIIGMGKLSHYETIRGSISSGDCPRSSVDNFDNIEFNFIGLNKKFSSLKFKAYMYEKIKPKFPYIEILADGGYRSLGSFQYSHISDSVIINGNFVVGLYTDIDSLISYNNTLGILKINKLNNKTWYKTIIK